MTLEQVCNAELLHTARFCDNSNSNPKLVRLSSCAHFIIAGAGGSVWIETPTLYGSGLIAANGGSVAGTNPTISGSGAGGRVSLLIGTMADFTGTLQAAGGVGGTSAAAAGQGSAGTVFTQTSTSKILLLNNLGRAGSWNTLMVRPSSIPTPLVFDTVKLEGYADLEISSAAGNMVVNYLRSDTKTGT